MFIRKCRDFLGGPVDKPLTANVESFMSGQETISHILQLKIAHAIKKNTHTHATVKIKDPTGCSYDQFSQININKKKLLKSIEDRK